MTLLTKLIMDFREKYKNSGILESATTDQQLKYEEMEKFLKDWQNPQEADKLLAIEQELQEVTNIMHKNLKDLLDRGENIE
jgi:synaptobrevin homolog YKT6